MNARVWSNISVWVLLAANLFPLIGVFFWGWDIYRLMVLYWTESAIVGFYGILGILLEAGAFSLFLVPFLCFHFGMFMSVHFMLLNALFGPAWAKSAPVPGILSKLILQEGLWMPMGLLFISHGVAFYLHVLMPFRQRPQPQGLPQTVEGVQSPVGRFLVLQLAKNVSGLSQVGNLMTAPYRRVVIMHLTILFGGFLVMLLHANLAAFVLMVALKIAGDLHGLVKVHKLADGSLVVGTPGTGNLPAE